MAYHVALCDEVGLELLGTIERWQKHKLILREAVRLARQQLFLGSETADGVLRIALASIVRAVWRNDAGLAEILIARSELVQIQPILTKVETLLFATLGFSRLKRRKPK